MKGPKTRGSAVERLPQTPMAQSLIEGCNVTPHSTIRREEVVGDCVGAMVGGAGAGAGGATFPQGGVVVTGPQSAWICGGRRARRVRGWIVVRLRGQ